jgi:hypothetical protein
MIDIRLTNEQLLRLDYNEFSCWLIAQDILNEDWDFNSTDNYSVISFTEEENAIAFVLRFKK